MAVMKKIILLLIDLLLAELLFCTIIIVNIDGSRDYTSIQEGIIASVDGDTVLVYPGRYFENTDFMGKTIVVGSLELTTGNRDYIHSTIIDGNQTGSCVAVHNDEGEGTELRGFTITNGIGYPDPYGRYGGGIYLSDIEIEIINCIIEHNSAEIGGGILIEDGIVSLTGNTFRFNDASMYGGGITSWSLTTPLLFSYENRNNVYCNFAALGQDIFNSLENGMITDVIVDTFTVSDPFGYEFYQGDYSSNQNYDSSVFEMQHARYERVEADLFVSTEGDDSNSGLTRGDPLQTITHALSVISADAENPRTIYLADGVYSSLLNNQKFPISMRGHVSIIGESEENTIIDLSAGHQGFVIDFFSDLGYEVKNLTIRDGFISNSEAVFNNPFYIRNRFHSPEPVLIENVTMQNNIYDQMLFVMLTNLTLRNVSFIDNSWNYGILTSSTSMTYGADPTLEREVLMENCLISGGETGLIYVISTPDMEPENMKFNIVNCEFSNCEFYNNNTIDYPVALSITSFGVIDMKIVNCTFAGNFFQGVYADSAPVHIKQGLQAEIINSIIYNNDTSHSLVIVGNTGTNPAPVADVHHCIIENGLDGVDATGDYVLNWDDMTIWDEDPLLLGEGEFPYKLQENSPAIDRGTLNMPEGIVLPEFDLAGNTRIQGNSIDLGCYEYNPWGSPVDEELIPFAGDLFIYPNPAIAGNLRNGQVNIYWSGNAGNSIMQFDIFNLKGQKVKSISELTETETGQWQAGWDLRNNEGMEVSSGVYFVRMKVEGEYLLQEKFTVVK
jgi:hypothetical protein